MWLVQFLNRGSWQYLGWQWLLYLLAYVLGDMSLVSASNGTEPVSLEKIMPITLESIDLERLEGEAKERAKKKVANLLQVTFHF